MVICGVQLDRGAGGREGQEGQRDRRDRGTGGTGGQDRQNGQVGQGDKRDRGTGGTERKQRTVGTEGQDGQHRQNRQDGQHTLISPALAAHSSPVVTTLTSNQYSVSTRLEQKLTKSAGKCSNTDGASVSPLSEVGLTVTWLFCNMQLLNSIMCRTVPTCNITSAFQHNWTATAPHFTKFTVAPPTL